MVNRRYFLFINKKMIKSGPSFMNEGLKVQAFNKHKKFTWGKKQNKKHKKTTPTYNCKWRSHVLEKKYYNLIYYIPNPHASLTHFLIVATYTNHVFIIPLHLLITFHLVIYIIRLYVHVHITFFIIILAHTSSSFYLNIINIVITIRKTLCSSSPPSILHITPLP
jgi:hypothetical protein